MEKPMGEPAPRAGEERVRTFWCRRRQCPNNLPRQSAGVPVGWLRLCVGVTGGRGHWMTLCGVGCLRALLEERPGEFVFDARIATARRRIDAVRARKAAGATEAVPVGPTATGGEPAGPAVPAAPVQIKQRLPGVAP